MNEPSDYPKFVQNSAEGKDRFPEKAQEKLSIAIAELISKKEPKSKIIGLEGEWGAGKTNVIRLIENQLRSTHHIYIHDVWSFQEDLQRRSFLESLTADLCRSKENEDKPFLLNKEKWEEKLRELLAKKREVTTDIVPVFSPGFLFVIALIVLWTIAGEFSGPIYLGGTEIHKRAYVLIIGLIGYLIFSFNARKFLVPKDVFYLYSEKDTKKITTETIYETEPSPERFHKWITELQVDFPKNKELIVVFDNMDRLPKEKIQQIWSLIHTFFSEKYFNKIWVIVPYSREHIITGLNRSDIETDHFIDKTFTIQYQVPPPILTEWKAFFDDVYHDAFGNMEEDELSIVRSIFDRLNEKITPRRIIIFINEIVSLKMIWKDEIPMRYMALYSLNKETLISNPVVTILSESYLDKVKLLFKEDEHLPNNIAALVYNVPVNKASQVTLYRAILNAMRNKSSMEMEELSKHPDFYNILDQVISREEIDSESCAIAVNYLETPSNNEYAKQSLNAIWHLIISKQNGARDDSQVISTTDKILFERANQSDVEKYILFLLKRLATSKNFVGDEYYKSLVEVESIVKAKKLKIKVTSVIEQVKLAPIIFLDYLNEAGINFSTYKVSFDEKALDDHLTSLAKNENFDAGRSLMHLKDKYIFPQLLAAVESRIEHGEVTAENVFNLFCTYKAITKTIPLSQKLSDSKITEIVKEIELNSDAYFELLAMRLARFDNFAGTISNLQTALQRNDEALVKEISERIECYCDYDDLLLKCITWDQPLLKAVAIKITSIPNADSRLLIGDILVKFTKIIDALKINPSILIDRLNPWTEDLKEELTKDTIPKAIPDVRFYEYALRTKNELTTVVLKIAMDYITSFSASDWTEYLLNIDSYPYKVIVEFLRDGKINSLPDNFITAYKGVIRDIASSEITCPEYDLGDWDLFYDKTDKLQIESLVMTIRDSFINRGDITPSTFAFFERAMRENGKLIERSGSVTRTILQPVLDDDGCFQILLKNRKFYAVVVANAGGEGLEFIANLRRRIEAKADSLELNEFGAMIDSILSDKVKIITAKYYSINSPDEKFIMVEDILKGIVETKKQLHFKIINEMFADGKDPEHGVRKDLYVEYEFENKPHHKTFQEHDWLRLP